VGRRQRPAGAIVSLESSRRAAFRYSTLAVKTHEQCCADLSFVRRSSTFAGSSLIQAPTAGVASVAPES